VLIYLNFKFDHGESGDIKVNGKWYSIFYKNTEFYLENVEKEVTTYPSRTVLLDIILKNKDTVAIKINSRKYIISNINKTISLKRFLGEIKPGEPPPPPIIPEYTDKQFLMELPKRASGFRRKLPDYVV